MKKRSLIILLQHNTSQCLALLRIFLRITNRQLSLSDPKYKKRSYPKMVAPAIFSNWYDTPFKRIDNFLE